MSRRHSFWITLCFLSFFFCSGLSLSGQETHNPSAAYEELSAGIGDQMFEMLNWHTRKNVRYSQHWFIRYLHHDGSRLGYGAMLDLSGAMWDSNSVKIHINNIQ